MKLHQCPDFLQEEGNLSPSSTALGWTAELSMLVHVFAGRGVVVISDDVKFSTDSHFFCMTCYFQVSFLALTGNHQEKHSPNARWLACNKFDSKASVLQTSLLEI